MDSISEMWQFLDMQILNASSKISMCTPSQEN